MTTLRLPRTALGALALRALRFWALVRLFLAVLALIFGGLAAANPFWIIVFCSSLGVAEVRMRREQALWGNLGLSTSQIALISALVALAGELLVAAARVATSALR